jgi:hypothetical protein
MKINDKKMEKTIMRLVNLFIKEEYAEIVNWSKEVRLTENEIKEAIDEWEQKVVFPPKDFFNHVDIMKIVDTDEGHKQWSVIFELWMDKDGKSDLSVELTFIESSEKYYDIELDNIHVL